MEEQLVNIDTATLAKKKGFNIPTCAYFNEGDMPLTGAPFNHNYSAYGLKLRSRPTISLLQKWLREVHKIDCGAEPLSKDGFLHWIGYYRSTVKTVNSLFLSTFCDIKDNWEDGTEQALQKTLNLLPDAKNIRSK